MPQVVKQQNGHRAEYDAGKVYTSLMRALHMPPGVHHPVDAAIERCWCWASGKSAWREIGEMVDERTGQGWTKRFRVRLPSVYRSFRTSRNSSDAIREISHHSPPQS